MACIFVRRQFKPKKGPKFLFFPLFFSGHIWTLYVKDLVMRAKNFEFMRGNSPLWMRKEWSILMTGKLLLEVREWYIHHPRDKRFPWDQVSVCVFVPLCTCVWRLTHPCSPMILTTRITCPSQQQPVPSPGSSKDTWCYWERGRDPLEVFYNDLEKRQMREISSISIWYQLLKATLK